MMYLFLVKTLTGVSSLNGQQAVINYQINTARTVVCGLHNQVISVSQNHNKSTQVDLSTPVDKGKFCLSSIGENVRTARENAGLSQEGLGKMIGKSKQAISKIEKDEFSSVERIKSTLILIAKALNNNLGESWLNQYVDESIPKIKSKSEIIQETSIDEYMSIKFGAKGLRTKAEVVAVRKKLDDEIKRMESEDDF